MTYPIDQWIADWCEPDMPDDTECLVSLGQLREWQAEIERLRSLAGQSSPRRTRVSKDKAEPQEQLCMDLSVG